MKKLIFIIVIAQSIYLVFLRDTPVSLGAGVMAPNIPRQAEPSVSGWTLNGYQITPLADFELQAKVLSRKNYYMGPTADLSPTDLALGWGAMSDESITQSFEISQSNRWYYWRTGNLPIPAHVVTASSANMHIIPADENVEYMLDKVREGDVVSLKGRLVRADRSDGWHWVSSLTRTDTGDGACELFYVEFLSIDTPI